MSCAVVCLAASLVVRPAPVHAQVTAFKQAVAEAAVRDADVAAFYRDNNYAALWTDEEDDRDRRAMLLRALSTADHHGLPAARYDVDGLTARIAAARSPRDLGLLEIELTRVFLAYARDLQTGVLVPSRVVSAVKREVPYRERSEILADVARLPARDAFRALVPTSPEYVALMRAKLGMERQLERGGWGPVVTAGKLEPGDSGPGVIELRNRLEAMGYLPRSLGSRYDAAMREAVEVFQRDHGLEPDGVAGADTMAEINVGMAARLQSVIVAMERERWLNRDRGARHVLVNLTDFTAKIIENEREVFSTRAVIGSEKPDRQSPEFSDSMEFMVINPSWYVPRSIVTKEYLPKLRANRHAVGHIYVTDRRGRVVNRNAVNFAQYSARNFPFAMRQPPGQRNALGLVKFMFPNPYNIYLHDTPSKDLFNREVRAFSHGCIRLADPQDFAHALLSVQEVDPEGYFNARLSTGNEQRVSLEKPLPVHLIYRTAFTTVRGQTQFRRDIYGRDAAIWEALSKAGVALRGVQG
ncbi:L,D-transpeptidase family protein [Sulfitobacter sp. D35]|nr:L,D-transpeptidase family protein [Sulfitobacter sp. D35]MDW4496723.1 L,D-transpeptidase family protein [Sulfitobacter sp. D35]